MQKKPTLLLIINPVAGRQTLRGYDLPSMFTGYTVTQYKTKNGAETEAYVRENAADYDLIVCAGGDGTLHYVINGLMRLPHLPPIGYIPCGTTNDFATGLQIPVDIPTAVKHIVSGTPQLLDACTFNTRFFSYVASFGAFSESSYKAPQNTKNRIGHMAYILEAVRDLPNIRACRMTVTTESASFTGDYLFGTVSNATSIGGMLHFDRADIRLNDGLFEILLIKMPRNVIDLQQIVFSLLRQDYNASYITFLHANTVRFSMKDVIPWSLDGEYEPGAKEIQIVNKPCVIPMLLYDPSGNK